MDAAQQTKEVERHVYERADQELRDYLTAWRERWGLSFQEASELLEFASVSAECKKNFEHLPYDPREETN
jgi:hypothetical protein